MIYAATKSNPVAVRGLTQLADLLANEAVYPGVPPPTLSDRITVPIFWDAALNSHRLMTQAEIDAVPTQKAAARATAEPDLAAFRDQSTAALTEIDTDQTEVDTAITRLGGATLTLNQLQGELKNAVQRQRRAMQRERRLHKVLLRFVAERL